MHRFDFIGGPRKWSSAGVVGTWKRVFEFYHRREECLVASCICPRPVNTWPCAGVKVVNA